MTTPTISIVSPLYNEAEGLAEFVRQITAVMDPLALDSGWELVLVNDGSRDASLLVATGRDPHRLRPPGSPQRHPGNDRQVA